jgi:hypothetical protein
MRGQRSTELVQDSWLHCLLLHGIGNWFLRIKLQISCRMINGSVNCLPNCNIHVLYITLKLFTFQGQERALSHMLVMLRLPQCHVVLDVPSAIRYMM